MLGADVLEDNRKRGFRNGQAFNMLPLIRRKTSATSGYSRVPSAQATGGPEGPPALTPNAYVFPGE